MKKKLKSVKRDTALVIDDDTESEKFMGVNEAIKVILRFFNNDNVVVLVRRRKVLQPASSSSSS